MSQPVLHSRESETLILKISYVFQSDKRSVKMGYVQNDMQMLRWLPDHVIRFFLLIPKNEGDEQSPIRDAWGFLILEV